MNAASLSGFILFRLNSLECMIRIIIFTFFLGLISCKNATNQRIENNHVESDSTQPGQEADHHKAYTEDDMHFFDSQEIILTEFNANGFILDIGGGGEGIIGLLMGPRVVAIDISKRELEDAPEGPLKIVMDARDLKFVDDSFETITIFFTLMYIDGSDHERVLSEVFRVLKPGGRLLIWDVKLTQVINDTEIVVFPLTIKLPDREISTGYGVKWPEVEQNATYYINIAERIGFSITEKKEQDMNFFLVLTKP